MADLTIPKEHQLLLNKIRTMPEATFRPLVLALERSPDVVPSVLGLSPEDSEAVYDVIKTLFRVRESLDMEVPELVSSVVTSIREAEAFPHDEISAFEERLTRLLSIESINLASKAESLKMEYERRFCSARILTDARPIYDADLSQPPRAAMIMHTLRLAYHDNTADVREFYVAMDDDDIQTMRKLLDRAEAKAKSLESLFDAAKIKLVSP